MLHVPSGPHSHAQEVLVWLVVEGSTPEVTLLVPISWLCHWQAVTFEPPGLSFLIYEVGIIVYLSCGRVTSSYFASCSMIHLNEAVWPPWGIWQCLRTFLLSQLGQRVLGGCRCRDAAKHATVHRTAPEQRTPWSNLSVVPPLGKPAVNLHVATSMTAQLPRGL